MKKQAYIFDIDGTLADLSHRKHFIAGENKNWDSFYAECGKDKPIESVCRVLRELSYPVIYITGRPQSYRLDTDKWLTFNDLPHGMLFMRPDGDHRPDFELKKEIYNMYIKDRIEILGVFEDRQQCVDMWRSLGLTCFQVADGNY